ncbi:hypothetical protein GGX14DRAFT_538280 [Mycena pura]|uniref:DUF4219 domain-containing protein n=1 Tax=Mycena pura TaxID=153505 RepID=A0AAD6YV86_9AGAR|nr:hypothetical protein GGX14DRAFT_538280 [Mycena pura]
MKSSDISKLNGTNYWTWKAEAQALLLAEGCWSAVDPTILVPNGFVQHRAWISENSKAYGLLYLALNPTVKAKINNPVLTVMTIEQRLTAITVSLPPHMVQDKILSISSLYSPITTVLENEVTLRPVTDMISAINAWEQADLQKSDSVIRAARSAGRDAAIRSPLSNHGGAVPDPALPEDPKAMVARARKGVVSLVTWGRGRSFARQELMLMFLAVRVFDAQVEELFFEASVEKYSRPLILLQSGNWTCTLNCQGGPGSGE